MREIYEWISHRILWMIFRLTFVISYIAPQQIPPVGQIFVRSMGIHEVMPPGMIRHGGPNTDFGGLLMVFHNPVRVLTPNGQEWQTAHTHFIAWDSKAEHQYGNDSVLWDHSWMRLDGRWFDQTLRNTSLPLGVPIDLGDELPLRHFQMLCEELRGNVRQDPEMLQAMMQVFWHDLERAFRSRSSPPRRDSRLDHARDFIESNFDRPFSLAKTAAKAHLSPAHFCHRFAKQFGVPPREYAMRLRMQRGAQLLANHELTVYQVAEMVGCPDPLYFSRLFRKRYGLSPNQFRRQEQSKSTQHSLEGQTPS